MHSVSDIFLFLLLVSDELSMKIQSSFLEIMDCFTCRLFCKGEEICRDI